jgi:hypothetical protein
MKSVDGQDATLGPMMTTASLLAAEEAATHSELAIPPWLVGVMALLLFAFLLGVTWSFRGTHNKYAAPTAHAEPTADDEPHWPEHPGQH